jgi:hypothetical protein
MPYTIDLREEDGTVIERWTANAYDLYAAMPGFDDLAYPYLRTVDPYGTTHFSSYQMREVVPELERLFAEHPLESLAKLLEMARACQAANHYDLVLIGD